MSFVACTVRVCIIRIITITCRYTCVYYDTVHVYYIQVYVSFYFRCILYILSSLSLYLPKIQHLLPACNTLRIICPNSPESHNLPLKLLRAIHYPTYTNGIFSSDVTGCIMICFPKQIEKLLQVNTQKSPLEMVKFCVGLKPTCFC